MCTSKFPASFKFANVTLVFKQGFRNQKNNYRPTSIILIISKIFEKLICGTLLSNHFDYILSQFQRGFRKTYSQQHCLLLMIDKWKKTVDNKVLWALLADLSKTFDCICHDLLVAKLNAYCLSFCTLKMIQDYVTKKGFEPRNTQTFSQTGHFGQIFECSFTNEVVVGSNPVAVTYISDITPVSSKEFLDIQLTIVYRV